MLFALKKFVSAFLYPLPLFVLGGIVVLLLTWRRQTMPRVAALLALLAVWAVGAAPVAWQLARPLERHYAPLTVTAAHADVRHIVVLSSAAHETPDRQIWDLLDQQSIRRVMEGVRLARVLPQATLVLSGGGPEGRTATAALMARFAASLGVPSERMVQETESLDTDDQALALAARLGKQPFLLVTSAYHLDRSLAQFRRAGTQPIAAPTDFLTGPGSDWATLDWLPTRHGVDVTMRAAHEYLGMAWMRLQWLMDDG